MGGWGVGVCAAMEREGTRKYAQVWQNVRLVNLVRGKGA